MLFYLIRLILRNYLAAFKSQAVLRLQNQRNCSFDSVSKETNLTKGQAALRSLIQREKISSIYPLKNVRFFILYIFKPIFIR